MQRTRKRKYLTKVALTLGKNLTTITSKNLAVAKRESDRFLVSKKAFIPYFLLLTSAVCFSLRR